MTSLLFRKSLHVATPLWGKCGDETHTPKSGDLKSSRTLKNSELDCKGQNTLHWNVLYTVEKVFKCKCPKWTHMSHLDMCSTSYGWKKGQKSNWQFDSRPLKVGNRPNPGVCSWNEAHHWKSLEDNYNFALDHIPIGGQSWELWAPKVPGVQTGIVSGLLLGSPGTKSHSDVGPMGERRE